MSHTYWRIKVSDPAPPFQVRIYEMEFRASVGGADLTDTDGGSAFASSASSGAPASEAFDNIESSSNYWGSTSSDPDRFIGWQFATPAQLAEIVIKVPDLFGNPNDKQPVDFQIQWSDDNVLWTTTDSYNGVSWSAFTPTSQTFAVSTPPVIFRFRQPWAEYLGWRFRQPWTQFVDFRFRQPWAEFQPDAALFRFRQPWSELTYNELSFRFRQPWREQLNFRFRQPWREYAVTQLFRLRQPWTELTYDELTFRFRQPWNEQVNFRFRQPWREYSTTQIFRLRQPWDELTYDNLTFRLRQPWREWLTFRFRQPITQAHDQLLTFRFRQPWSEQTYNNLLFRFRQPWVELSDSYQAFTGDIYITVDGKRIELDEATLSADEDSPYWQARIRLANLSDYARFSRDTAFTLHFYGTDYALIADTRSLTRSFSTDGQPQDAATLTALSPLAEKASPRSDDLERTWDTPTMARSIVEELIGSVTWETVNWSISANRFSANSAPLEAARQITDAVGAIVLSDPNGNVIIRPRYPVSIPSYGNTAQDLDLTAHDIYSADEQISARDHWNRVIISNGENSLNRDRLEFVPDEIDGLKGELHAYPSPWEPAVTISTTRNGVTLTRLGASARIETETIEIVEGRGSVRYPVNSINSLIYLDSNLGGASFDGAEITTAVSGYSLLTITYRTRYIAYSARVTSEREAQILLERP